MSHDWGCMHCLSCVRCGVHMREALVTHAACRGSGDEHCHPLPQRPAPPAVAYVPAWAIPLGAMQ